jgi:hypothetical protein
MEIKNILYVLVISLTVGNQPLKSLAIFLFSNRHGNFALSLFASLLVPINLERF